MSKKPRGLLYGEAEHVLEVLDGLMPDLDAPAVQEQIKQIVSLLSQEPLWILQKNPYFSSHLEDVDYRYIALGKLRAFVHEPRRYFDLATLNTLEVASFEFLNQLAGGFTSYTEEWSERRPKLAGAMFSFLHYRNVELAREHGTPQLKKGNDLRLRKAAAKRQMIRNCATYFERKGKERKDFAGLIFKLQGRTIELEGKNTKVDLKLRRPSSVQRILKQLGI